MKLYSQAGKTKAMDLGLYRPVIRRSSQHHQQYDTVPLRSLRKRRDLSPFDLMASRGQLFQRRDSGGDVLILKYKSDFDKIIQKQKKHDTLENRIQSKSIEKQKEMIRLLKLSYSSTHETTKQENNGVVDKMRTKLKGLVEFSKQMQRQQLFKEISQKATIDCPQSYDIKSNIKLPTIKFKKQVNRSFYEQPIHCTRLDYSPNYSPVLRREDNVGPAFEKSEGRSRSVVQSPELGNFMQFETSKMDLLKSARGSNINFNRMNPRNENLFGVK